jgi:uncharacterized membrane protein HdeD (DUF308 family)
MTAPGGGQQSQRVFPGSRLPRWGRTRGAMLTAALATFVLGLIMLAWPGMSLALFAVLIGVALLVTGILRLVQSITDSDESGASRAAYVIIGILAVLAGLYALRHIAGTVAVLAVIVGLFWAVQGVTDIMVAATAPAGRGRAVTAVVGILSLAAGLIVIFWPGISIAIVVTVLGIWLLCYGVLLAFLAFQLRPASRA